MIGVEFDSHEAAEAVQEAAFHRGLLTLECGESSLRFSPPLIVDAAAVDTALRIFGESLPGRQPPGARHGRDRRLTVRRWPMRAAS